MDYSQIITMEPGKRSGKPCIRGLRITVGDVLGYLASGMTHAEILRDFPYLTEEDSRACLAFAADRERKSDCGGVKLLFDENLSPRLVLWMGPPARSQYQIGTWSYVPTFPG